MKNLTNTLQKYAKPVLQINGFSKNYWCRNVKNQDKRKGPWLSANYRVINDKKWNTKGACVYLVINEKSELKYVGKSKNKLKDRWRTSPAFDQFGNALGRKELFHNQCWPHMCEDSLNGNSESYEVMVLGVPEINDFLNSEELNTVILNVDTSDHALFVQQFENWLINISSGSLWNK